MFDLAEATPETFTPHVGTAFRLTHPEIGETFTLDQVTHLPVHADPARKPFSLIFNGGRSDVQFDQQIIPLTHDALGELRIFMVPIGRNENGTIRYQAVFT